jgi:hypothetical protein
MRLTNRNLGGLTPAEAVTAGKGERQPASGGLLVMLATQMHGYE